MQATLEQPTQRRLIAVGTRQYRWGTEHGTLYLHWCCGASLEVDYFKHGIDTMSQRLAAFLEGHEQCMPGETRCAERQEVAG